jgi:hypothetical protein
MPVQKDNGAQVSASKNLFPSLLSTPAIHIRNAVLAARWEIRDDLQNRDANFFSRKLKNA